MPDQIRIKFSARTAADQDPNLWLSLFKGNHPEIRGCTFLFDPDENDYDWFVVYEDLMFLPGQKKSMRIESLKCPRQNTLFITTEPTSIKIYGRNYLRQFGHILSVQPRHIIDHPGHIFETPPLRWYYGRPLQKDDNQYINIDSYNNTPPHVKKHDVSTVCSDKQMSITLKQRYNFVAGLKSILGDEFDWFGRGIRPISDKSEAMDSYRYHIAIENHIEDHHWTEKIADCFLAYCLPFYYGSRNITEYFPKDSIIPIDIFDVEGSAQIIRKAIAEKTYEDRLPAIIKAREKVLSDYNLMYKVAEIVRSRHQNTSASKNEYIYGRHIFRTKHPFKASSDALHRIRYKSS